MAGPIVLVDSGQAVWPTYGAHRQEFADLLGFYQAATTSVVGSGGDTRRLLAFDELRDDEWGQDVLGDIWAYVVNGVQGGAQRRVLDLGYEGPLGALVVSRPFAQPLAAKTLVELTSPLPSTRIGLVKGLAQILVEAYRRIYVEVRLGFTGNGTHEHAFSDWPSLVTKQAQVLGIYDRHHRIQNLPMSRSAHDSDVKVDGATLTLQTRICYGEGETFEVSALVPGSCVVLNDGAWTVTADGPTSDDQQVAVPTRWAMPVAMAIGLDYCLQHNEHNQRISDAERTRREQSYARRLTTRWGPAAAEILRVHGPRRPTDPPRQIVATVGRSHPRYAHWRSL